MWDNLKNRFGLVENPPVQIVQDQPITTRKTLYVKKDGDDYMVSHLPLGGGYDKYTANGKCWTFDGVSSATANPPVVVPEMVKDTLIANTKCKEKKAPEVYKTSGDDSVMKVAIMNHVRIRFAQLNCILDANPNVKVIIGGGTVDDSTYIFKEDGKTKPTLGRVTAVGQWKTHDETPSNGEVEGKNVADAIENYCNDLMGTFNESGKPKRIFIGVVGFAHQLSRDFKKSRENEESEFAIGNLDPSEKLIHVWGANIGNFNKSNDPTGSGQATAVRHRNAVTPNSNVAGAFGIITTPVGATAETINASNEELLKLFADDSAGGSKPRNRTRSKKRRNSRKSK